MKFLNDTRSGVVVGMDGGLVVVEDEDGFEIPVAPGELILQSAELDRVLRDTSVTHTDKAPARPATKAATPLPNEKYRIHHSHNDRDRFMEVDLHIHELIDSNRGLSNYDMLRLQLSHFERMIELARNLRIKRVVFIHGVGEGVLKSEIRKALQYEARCRYRDADFRVYGSGGTEVLLW